MKRYPLNLVLLLAIVLFTGNCRKNELSLESSELTFTVSGRITDVNDQPVGQAQVKAGSATAVTDINGYFTIANARSPKDAAYVKVEKAGYFPGSRTFIATARATNYVSISLIPKVASVNFLAADGGNVPVDGGSITFPRNGIVDANGAPYNGMVSLATFFIDPTAANFSNIMPGALRGININNEQRVLESFGMMAVEMTSPGGQKLQIAPGKAATMNFDIPAALVSKAPNTIPLWYFDEEKGLWKEEGSAVKTGNKYIGTVSHFSFWNCDAPFPLIQLEMVVKDQSGNPVPNAEVLIRRGNDGSGSGRTDSEGRIRGMVPANEVLELMIRDRCGSVIHTQNIGPYTSNTNLGTITVNIPNNVTVTISGTAVNCSNVAVTNGYASLYLDGMNYRAQINNGNFSITAQRCSSSSAVGELHVVDVGGSQQSAPVSLTITSGAVNAGSVQACGVTTSEFVNYTLGTTQYSFTVPPDTTRVEIGANTTIQAKHRNNSAESFYLQFEGTGTGTHAVKYLNIFTLNNVYFNGSNAINVNVTEYGSPGGYIAGNFTGNLRDSLNNNQLPVNCNFRVKRP